MTNDYYLRIQHSVHRFPRWLRLCVGVLLLFGGILGFLPILGFWMFPLGLLVLSYDLPTVRRWRRRLEVKWLRRWRGRKVN
ncbi:MAG: hypothetical protein QGG19_10445 [Alphaproteobacteria bacterium]|jgi:hypothetical protein|nr:hypothetical protein [Alphaproteobacteria bacterium]MDP6257356.1 hypothetical protein [Alphaproteobacteria bacterium]MDP7055291.1 hypothetical protein [Alphaproteobacteria bacterium]MDP7229048.1 hypothetical protein [Alphaproteobacteria bacterium]MDP7459743.1 hypothetical protein [Alphaproteobacteria bacterium]|tara:strand:- start:460 stop:702 length:243 start_codon:yes stop_codon:yes gene_type:complete